VAIRLQGAALLDKEALYFGAQHLQLVAHIQALGHRALHRHIEQIVRGH